MRRTILSIIFIAASAINGFSQKSADQLFEKYSGKDGFVSISINGDVLKLAKSFDNDDEGDKTHWSSNITGIRILVQENDQINTDDFYKSVMKDINLRQYEEFMKIRETDRNIIMLVRTEGNIFREFLLISGGRNDNALIQVKGNMTMRDARRLRAEIEADGSLNIL